MAGFSTADDNLVSWELSDTEIAFNLEKTAKTRSSSQAEEWKLFVPKIMPLLQMGLPKETVCPLDSTGFINEKSCRPVIQRSIKECNYVLARRPANCSFVQPTKWHGMKIEVEVLNKNPDNLRITNHIDGTNPDLVWE